MKRQPCGYSKEEGFLSQGNSLCKGPGARAGGRTRPGVLEVHMAGAEEVTRREEGKE